MLVYGSAVLSNLPCDLEYWRCTADDDLTDAQAPARFPFSPDGQSLIKSRSCNEFEGFA
jgi:hypothetical protein